jgi:hypothetical protein
MYEQTYELKPAGPIKNDKKCDLCRKWFDFEVCVLIEEHQEWFLHPHCLGRYLQ